MLPIYITIFINYACFVYDSNCCMCYIYGFIHSKCNYIQCYDNIYTYYIRNPIDVVDLKTVCCFH